MLHTFAIFLNQAETEQQRGVNRVRWFSGETRKFVKAAQPVAFLSQVTVMTAITGRLKKTVVRAVFEIDILQYTSSWIR
jgi:hypothetical protein